MKTPVVPLPRLVLRVGALGNRRFGRANGIDADGAVLMRTAGGRCREILTLLRDHVRAIHARERAAIIPALPNPAAFARRNLFGWIFGRSDWWHRRSLAGTPAPVFSEEAPRVEILSGLAEGADRLVAEEAWAMNGRGDGEPIFEMVSVTVEEEDVPRWKSDKVREGLSVGRIPSAPAERPPLPTRELAQARALIRQRRAEGFRAQSDALRHHSDLLLAVWDADAEGQPGGTAESVVEALRQRVPVLAVRFNAQGEAVADLLRSVDDLREVPGQIGLAALEPCLHQILCFPDTLSETGPRHLTSYDPRVAFHRFRDGLPVPVSVAWPAALWTCVRRLMERGYCQENGLHATEPPASPGPKSLVTHYEASRSLASVLSEAFGDAHRGGILWSYLLAALAVLLALAGIHLHHLHAPVAVLCGVAVVEVCIIATLWALAEIATFEDWHEAYTDLRLLAEALRHTQHLAPLGVHPPLPKLPPYLAGSAGGQRLPSYEPRRLWTVWYFRTLIRNAPLRVASPPDLSPAEQRRVLLEDWIGAPDSGAQKVRRGTQAEYHRRNHHVQGRLIHGLEKTSQLLFVTILTVALLHLGSLLGQAWTHGETPPDNRGGSLLFALTLWLVVGGPVLLAAINGFLSQIEAVRLQQRSRSMAAALEERHRVLAALDVESDPESVTARWGLARTAAATAGLMLDETAAWTLIYKNTDIHAG